MEKNILPLGAILSFRSKLTHFGRDRYLGQGHKQEVQKLFHIVQRLNDKEKNT